MKAISQKQHAEINAKEYPGTRQMCVCWEKNERCEGETGRCEEDAMYDKKGNGPYCMSCYDEKHPDGEEADE